MLQKFRWLVLGCLLLAVANVAIADGTVDLGNTTLSDWQVLPLADFGAVLNLGSGSSFGFSQPTVQVEIQKSSGGTFDMSFLNEFLLDTGATGVIVGQPVTDDLNSQSIATVANFSDYGVAGTTITRVTAPYTFGYAGTNGVVNPIPGAQLELSPESYGLYPGVAGMPLMVGKTVTLDLAAQADQNLLQVGVAFSTSAPAAAAHQYSVPLTMVNFPAVPDSPGAAVPTTAPLSFAPIAITSGSHRVEGHFLVDTGAQQSIISSDVAQALGLDLNNPVDTTVVQGVGGQITIPIFQLDTFSMHTNQGVDMTFRDVQVGVIDIPGIAGVMGFNILNSGWEEYALEQYLGALGGLGIDLGDLSGLLGSLPQGASTPGAFQRVDFDFRNAASLTGTMYLTLDPTLDVVQSVPEPASCVLLVLGACGLAIVAKRNRQ